MHTCINLGCYCVRNNGGRHCSGSERLRHCSGAEKQRAEVLHNAIFTGLFFFSMVCGCSSVLFVSVNAVSVCGCKGIKCVLVCVSSLHHIRNIVYTMWSRRVYASVYVRVCVYTTVCVLLVNSALAASDFRVGQL